MSGIRVQPLTDHDLPALADMVAALPSEQLERWLGFIPGLEQLQRHTVLDPDVDPELLLGAFDATQLAGCVLGVRRPWKAGNEHVGFIKWILVRPAWRRRGIGRRLLEVCERTLTRRGATDLVFGSCAPRYVLPGTPEDDVASRRLFRACGWRESSQRTSLRVTLDDRPIDALGVGPPSHIGLGLATAQDSDALGRFITTVFSLSWREEVYSALVGDTQAFCSVLRDSAGGQILGFAAVNATNPGWFGPMGVHPERRGQGLGRLLVRHACAEAQRRGASRLMLPWVNENEGFYRHAVSGALERQVFLKTEKPVNGATAP